MSGSLDSTPQAGLGMANRPTLPPFVALSSRFMKRTALATVITLGLVASAAAVYFHEWGWAGRYLITGLWSVGFFVLTPLIIKLLVFDQKVVTGLLLGILKFAMMAGIFLLARHWSQDETISAVALGSSLIAGITTPLAVAALRVMGMELGEKRKPKNHE